MAISIAWLLDELGNKLFSWSTTKAVMDFDRGGENGQTLQKTLKDIESSSGDMRKDVFAMNGKPGVVDKAQYAENGINIYIHSKEGTVHNFQGEGSNGKALLTANFEEGDSITVNGAPVTAYIGTDEAVVSMAINEWNGKWITFTFDGDILNFKGGNGLNSEDKSKLIPENIREGVTIAKVTGNLLPSCKENSLVCSWAKVYDSGEKPAVVGNITVDSPISVSDTGITVKRAFSAFVMKFPYSLHDTAQGSSSIPEGQVNFTEGQSFSVSVNPVHGYSRTSGIVILLAVNG